MAWIAQVVFFGCFALNYWFPSHVLALLTALAAAVIAALLIFDNRGSLPNRRA